MDRPVPAMIHRGRSVRLALNSDGFG
jgi:hypothetical protein